MFNKIKNGLNKLLDITPSTQERVNHQAPIFRATPPKTPPKVEGKSPSSIRPLSAVPNAVPIEEIQKEEIVKDILPNRSRSNSPTPIVTALKSVTPKEQTNKKLVFVPIEEIQKKDIPDRSRSNSPTPSVTPKKQTNKKLPLSFVPVFVPIEEIQKKEIVEDMLKIKNSLRETKTKLETTLINKDDAKGNLEIRRGQFYIKLDKDEKISMGYGEGKEGALDVSQNLDLLKDFLNTVKKELSPSLQINPMSGGKPQDRNDRGI